MNFAYKRSICREMKRSGIKPNENILRRIEQSVALAKQTILKKVLKTTIHWQVKSGVLQTCMELQFLSAGLGVVQFLEGTWKTGFLLFRCLKCTWEQLFEW